LCEAIDKVSRDGAQVAIWEATRGRVNGANCVLRHAPETHGLPGQKVYHILPCARRLKITQGPFSHGEVMYNEETGSLPGWKLGQDAMEARGMAAPSAMECLVPTHLNSVTL
jgi:hypothetical protein